MKFKINTDVFKSMMAKAIKGVGDNKLIPITQLMGIEVKDKELAIITTDATNYLYITNQIDTDGDFSVTVYADQFAKLISKMTSEYTTLEIKNKSLEVKGNGTYTIELPLDENGNPIQYPNPYEELPSDNVHITNVSLSMIKTALESLKGSLATNMEMPVITQYYTGENILATNRYLVAAIDSRFCDTDMLVSAECMNLLDNMTDENITVFISDKTVVFKSTGCIVYTKQTMKIDDYPNDTLYELLKCEFPHSCTIDKIELLNLLDRMTLFASDVTRQLAPVTLEFSGNELTVYNSTGKSSEGVTYDQPIADYDEPFSCQINIALLTSQLKSYAGDRVDIHFGDNKLIKFVDGSITQIIALV